MLSGNTIGWAVYGYHAQPLTRGDFPDIAGADERHFGQFIGPGWAKTLLAVTYDEHGGCYDHVPPPSGATPPAEAVGEFGFDFTRFGVRVPPCWSPR